MDESFCFRRNFRLLKILLDRISIFKNNFAKKKILFFFKIVKKRLGSAPKTKSRVGQVTRNKLVFF